jgi:hypothetical protein
MNPLPFTWNGEAMEIARGFAPLADKRFVVGQRYVLDVVEERSAKSHAAYFAAVTEAWKTLPEHLTEQFPTADHLRKFCLIKADFHDHRSIVANSKAEAQRIAAFIKPMDSFAVVTVKDCVINVYTARSQKLRAMNRQEFEASKKAVLDILDDMLGVERGTVQKQGAAA